MTSDNLLTRPNATREIFNTSSADPTRPASASKAPGTTLGPDHDPWEEALANSITASRLQGARATIDVSRYTTFLLKHFVNDRAA